MFDTPFIVPVVLFLSVATILVLRGPLGKAMADRIAGRVPERPGLPDEHVTAELEDMRRRVGELEERLDFAERLLAKSREQGHLGAGGGPRAS